ncbi:phosphonate C-P lyase system protein PhnG [Paenibacillus yanchengensis]|uniref:Phosphonate C-P lyase system protein PhnG n=1 Tax=Paenibacillus yanchengensis TaxID=2035833 RepID=A0ABW4YJ77_9BACL
MIKGTPEIAAALALEIKDRYRVTIIEEPNHGLVMVKVRESAQKSLFYLGEVLVTECKVQIEGKIGIGILKGDEPERAYDLAVIDAAYEAQLQEITAWSTILSSEADRIAREQKVVDAAVLRTKVNFETMDTDGEEMRK